MFKQWKGEDALKCIVLCAGRGSRMNPQAEERPKVMFEVNNRPTIHYVINYWRQFTEDFIFIVGYKKEMVIDYVSREPVKSNFIEQTERKGIAHAIMQAENAVNDKFIVVLGDCICKGDFQFLERFDQAVGVWKTDNKNDIHQSYSVEVKGGLIKRVVEKPKIIANNLCGMGFYFFKRKLFDYIRVTPPSSLRNEVEITDVIQKMIEAGEPINPLLFNGDYVNITYPEDIERTETIIRQNTKEDFKEYNG